MNEFELENLLMTVTVKTVNTLLSEENGSDALGLYFFYYKMAKSQRTNQVWANRSFCLKALHWGPQRFLRAQAIIKKYKLVEVIKGSKVNDKWYVKISFISAQKSKVEVVSTDTSSKEYQNEGVSTDTANALSNINTQNALSNITTTNVVEEFGNSSINSGIKLLTSLSGQTPNKMQLNRFALKRLYKTYGEERTLKALQFAFSVRDMSYAPQIYNFLDLEEKWARLEGFARRKVNSPKVLNVEDFKNA